MGVESLNEKDLSCDLTFHPLYVLILYVLCMLLMKMKGSFFMRKNVTQKLVLSALLIAVTVALKCTASIMLPFAGAGGMRISLSVFFSKLPAILFGPAFGAMSSVLNDVIPTLIKPDGAYIPLLTVTAALGGLMCGFLWNTAVRINAVRFKKIFVAIFVSLFIIGAVNSICVTFFADGAYTLIIKSMGEKRCWFVTWGLVAASFAGALIFVLDVFVSQKDDGFEENFMKLLCVLLIANLTVTTLNTFVLRMFIPNLKKLAFFVFYIPRLIEEIIATVIQAYASAYFLKILSKYSQVKNSD